jgi:hypothetical protein
VEPKPEPRILKKQKKESDLQSRVNQRLTKPISVPS